MIKNKSIQELLQRQMTRKEFLRVVGLAVLTIFGVTNMLKGMEDSFSGRRPTNLSEYGESSYGG